MPKQSDPIFHMQTQTVFWENRN